MEENNPDVEEEAGSQQKKHKGGKEPFRRISKGKDEADPHFKDNSFHAKTGDGWGKKAAQDFAYVQGKNFRHEKTKKKRGSYKGGEINMGIHSVKFSDNED